MIIETSKNIVRYEQSQATSFFWDVFQNQSGQLQICLNYGKGNLNKILIPQQIRSSLPSNHILVWWTETDETAFKSSMV